MICGGKSGRSAQYFWQQASTSMALPLLVAASTSSQIRGTMCRTMISRVLCRNTRLTRDKCHWPASRHRITISSLHRHAIIRPAREGWMHFLVERENISSAHCLSSAAEFDRRQCRMKQLHHVCDMKWRRTELHRGGRTCSARPHRLPGLRGFAGRMPVARHLAPQVIRAGSSTMGLVRHDDCEV